MSNLINIVSVDVSQDYIPIDVCKRIKNKLMNLNSKDSNCEFDIWENSKGDPDFELLKQVFLNNAYALTQKNSNNVDKLNVTRGWPVSYSDYDYQAPHHHGTTFLIGVAYIDVSDDSGDLLIQDPLSPYDWIERTDKRRAGNCRSSIPITPVPGLIVVMPGYLIHSTEPKPPGKNRLIIATNIEK